MEYFFQGERIFFRIIGNYFTAKCFHVHTWGRKRKSTGDFEVALSQVFICIV